MMDIVNKKYCDILSKITFTQFIQICNTVEHNNLNDDNHINKITFTQFIQIWNTMEHTNLNDDNHINNNNTNDDMFIQYKMLSEYCKNMILNNYVKTQIYSYANNKKHGRTFVSGYGLQRIWSYIRGVLCNNIMLDIDMKNAHPTIFKYICNINNIVCINLDSYIKNRDHLLNEFVNSDNIDKTTAKLMFIKALNKDKHITHIKIKKKKVNIKNSFFIEFDKEIKQIQLQLIYIYNNEYLTNKQHINPIGKFINYLLCKYEHDILEHAIAYLHEHGYIPLVNMFDGIMIKHDEHINNINLINGLNTKTLQYNITWDIKPHNLLITPLLDSLNIDDNIFSYLGKTEIDITNFCLENILKNKIYNCCGENWIYDNCVWVNNNLDVILQPIISRHDLSLTNTTGTNKTIKNISKFYNSLITIIKLIISHAPANPTFNNKLHNDTLQKLCYLNGFYCFKSNKFIEYTSDNIPYTTLIINRNYIDTKPCKEDIDLVFINILHPIFNINYSHNNADEELINIQYMHYLLKKFSRMLAGHIEDKRFIMMLGHRNSGKGTIESIFINTFEQYIGTFNTDNLVCKTSIGEASKIGAWMINFRFKRLMYGNELRVSDTQKMNGILLKQLVSGGDKLTARGNNKDEISFKIQSSIVLTANEIPICEPSDAFETVIPFNMQIKFMTDETYNNLSSTEKLVYKRGVNNDKIKQLCLSDKYIIAFEYIILNAYCNNIDIPDTIQLTHNDNNNELSDDKRFLELLEFGKTYIILNSDIKTMLHNNNINITINKCGNFLLQAGCTRYKENNKRGFNGCRLQTYTTVKKGKTGNTDNKDNTDTTDNTETKDHN